MIDLAGAKTFVGGEPVTSIFDKKNIGWSKNGNKIRRSLSFNSKLPSWVDYLRTYMFESKLYIVVLV